MQQWPSSSGQLMDMDLVEDFSDELLQLVAANSATPVVSEQLLCKHVSTGLASLSDGDIQQLVAGDSASPAANQPLQHGHKDAGREGDEGFVHMCAALLGQPLIPTATEEPTPLLNAAFSTHRVSDAGRYNAQGLSQGSNSFSSLGTPDEPASSDFASRFPVPMGSSGSGEFPQDSSSWVRELSRLTIPGGIQTYDEYLRQCPLGRRTSGDSACSAKAFEERQGSWCSLAAHTCLCAAQRWVYRCSGERTSSRILSRQHQPPSTVSPHAQSSSPPSSQSHTSQCAA